MCTDIYTLIAISLSQVKFYRMGCFLKKKIILKFFFDLNYEELKFSKYEYKGNCLLFFVYFFMNFEFRVYVRK